MPNFQLRFLKPDDTVRHVEELESASDAEARSYVLQHYPQRATELWDGERRVSRRVSPRHESRLRGEYPWECLYPVLSRYELGQLERSGPLPYSDFQRLGGTGMAVLARLSATLSGRCVSVRAVSHPAAPATIVKTARYALLSVAREGDGWTGSSHCTVWSSVEEGADVTEGLVADAAAGLLQAHAAEGILWPGRQPTHTRLARVGLRFASSALVGWRLPPTTGPCANA